MSIYLRHTWAILALVAALCAALCGDVRPGPVAADGSSARGVAIQSAAGGLFAAHVRRPILARAAWRARVAAAAVPVYTFSSRMGHSYQVSLRQHYLSVIATKVYGATDVRTVQTLRLSLTGHTASGAAVLHAVGGTGRQDMAIQGRAPTAALISPAATQALTVTPAGLLQGASGLNEGFRSTGSAGGTYSSTVTGLVPSGPWTYGLGILPSHSLRAALTWSTPAGTLAPVFIDPSNPATLQPLQALGAAGLLDQNLIVPDPAFPYLLSGRGVFAGYRAQNTVLSLGRQMVDGYLHQLLHVAFRASAVVHTSSTGDLGSVVLNHAAPLRTAVDGSLTVSGSWTADLTEGWIRGAHMDISAPLRFIYTPAGTAAQNKLWQGHGLPTSLTQPFRLTMDMAAQ